MLVIFDFYYHGSQPHHQPPYTIWQKSVTLRESKTEGQLKNKKNKKYGWRASFNRKELRKRR